jgi:hypothetical protein
VPLPSDAQQPERQSRSPKQFAAHEAVVELGSSYAHVVPEQQELGLSRQGELTLRQACEQYCEGAHTDALPLVSGVQHPLGQSPPELQSVAQVLFAGERTSLTQINPTQHAPGSALQTVPSLVQCGAPPVPPT